MGSGLHLHGDADLGDSRTEAHKLYECARLSEDDIGREKGTLHMDRFFSIDFSERDLSGALKRQILKKAVIDVRFLPILSLIKSIRGCSQQAHRTIVYSDKQGHG
jgi:hypothetical protein